MSAADTAKLLASLDFKDNATPGINKAIGSTQKLDSAFATMGKNIGGHVSQGMAAATKNIERGLFVIGGIVASQFALGVKSLAELQAAGAQTAAVIKSTGNAAHVTATGIQQLSASLEDKTAIDEIQIQQAANLLLTFTKLRNETGKGNDIFNQSVAILTDMSTALGTDVTSSAIQLGKALQDPVAGATSLKRVGVVLDDQQKKQIVTFMKAGKVMEAQKVILAELTKEFGGSAAAAAGTYEGKMKLVGHALEELQRSLATAAMPALTEIADFMNATFRDPATIKAVEAFGKELAGGVKAAVGWLKSGGWQSISGAIGTAVDAAKALVGAFTSMPSWVQELLIGGFVANKFTGGMVSNIIGDLGKGLIKGVLGMNAGVVNINAAVVNGGGGLPGGAGGKLGAAAAGAAAGTGLALTTAVVAPLAVAAAATIIQGNIDKQAGDLNAQAAIFAKNASDADLANSLKGVKEQLSGMAFNTFDSKNKVVDVINLLTAEQNRRATGGTGPLTHGSADRATAGGGSVTFVASLPKNIAVTLAAMGPGAAGVYERGIKKGVAPSMASVAGTLAKNVAAAKAATAAAAKGAAAASKTTAAVFAGAEKTGARLLGVQRTIAAKNYRPNITTMVTVPVTVNTSVSVRDVLGRVATYGSYGKVRAIGKVGGW